MTKKETHRVAPLVLDFSDSNAIISLWLKAVLLFPVWAMPIVLGLGFVAALAHCFCAIYFVVMLLGLLYFWHDYLKLKLILQENKLKIGLRTVDLNNLKSIYVEERGGAGNFLWPKFLMLDLDQGKPEALSVYRFTPEGAEAFVNYIKSHVPACKVNRTVDTYLQDVKRSVFTVKVRIFNSSIIAQMFEALKNLKVWWSEKALLLVLFLCFPIWMQTTLGFMCVIPITMRLFNSIELPALPISYLMSALGWIFVQTGEGIHMLHENTVFLWGSSIFVLVLLSSFLRDLIAWKECIVSVDDIAININSVWGSFRTKRFSWSLLQKMELKDDILEFAAGENSYSVNLKNVNPLDRSRLLQTIYKFAPAEIFSLEDQQKFQPTQNFSYTELWLQSLTQSPQQDSLLPLETGGMLKEGVYEVLEIIGAGGQGTAYLCNKAGAKEKVVLKETIFPVFVDKSVRKTAIDRFEQEASILKSLHHDGVVRLLDAFVQDHRGYVVLEHIDGVSLRTLRKVRELDEESLKDLIVQMCDVLEFLHQEGFTHRDFTPENLILDKNNKLKLIDFAVAHKISEGITATVVGKHSYIAPEQFRGRACPQSDIYSLGATIFFLVTGRDPEPITMQSLAEGEPFYETIYSTIIENCTRLDLSVRYPSVKRIKNDLCDESHTITITSKEKEEAWQN